MTTTRKAKREMLKREQALAAYRRQKLREELQAERDLWLARALLTR